MDTIISPTEMREVVKRQFRQYGVEAICCDDLEERVRVEDGRRVAHCYRSGRLFAMWMVDIGLLQFYDDDGNMLQTLNLLEVPPADRRAA